MPIKVEAVVVCDEVRQELSGKHILIGAYGGVIGLPAAPYNLRISWWIQMIAEKGDHKVDFRVVGPNDVQLIEGGMTILSKEGKRSAITLPRMQIQLQQEGTIRLEWRVVGESQWEVLKEMDVKFRKSKESASVSDKQPEGNGDQTS